MEDTTLDAIIALAQQSSTWEELDEWIIDQSSFAFEDGDVGHFASISDSTVKQLIHVMENNRSIPSKTAVAITVYFESEWLRLSSHQKEMILNSLPNLYRSSDKRPSSVRYAIVELLGKYYASEEAFNILLKFITETECEGKALATWGIGQFIQHTMSKSMLAQALKVLEKLRKDPCAEVRDEATSALSRAQRAR